MRGERRGGREWVERDEGREEGREEGRGRQGVKGRERVTGGGGGGRSER